MARAIKSKRAVAVNVSNIEDQSFGFEEERLVREVDLNDAIDRERSQLTTMVDLGHGGYVTRRARMSDDY